RQIKLHRSDTFVVGIVFYSNETPAGKSRWPGSLWWSRMPVESFIFPTKKRKPAGVREGARFGIQWM
ncbi:MAG: hypothetical protein D6714_15465, partial [Bacteroidetes bacterium]